jgi:hypothetical protein
MNANEISRAIIAGQWSTSDLNQIVEAARFAQERRARQVVNTVGVGTHVKFQGRRGEVQGVVTKVNHKTLIVKATTGMTWRVAASLCTPVFAGATS